MSVYDPKQVTVVVGGRFITGFADGTFVNAEKLEDNFTEYVGAQGEVSTAENGNKTGEITVTLASTSPSCSYLDGLASRKGENAFIPSAVVDGNSGRTMGGSRTRVRKPADAEFGNEVTEREYTIFVADYEVRG